ncbi:MAG: hypothetical protein ACSHX8_12485 [Opitutaceae bacterium]
MAEGEKSEVWELPKDRPPKLVLFATFGILLFLILIALLFIYLFWRASSAWN